MGKGKKVTVGYWYQIAYHHGLGVGPIDALLEFRGGDKSAWRGNLTQSGTIRVDAPFLWGGEKDQGGIVGDLDVMFGEATQMPNAYLRSTFGGQQSAWRGLSTIVFKGGKYGAMNPYPQKPSYKIRKIKKGWDNDICWYPEKAALPILAGEQTTINDAVYLDANTSSPDGTGGGYDFTLATGGMLIVRLGSESDAWSYTPSDDYSLSLYPRTWTHRFGVRNLDTGVVTTHWLDTYLTAAEARAAHNTESVSIEIAAGSHRFFLYDAAVDDNRGYGSYSLRGLFGGSAMNPAHILYYAITQPDMGREPEANINGTSFTAAADWFYARGFGLCTSYDPSAESVEEFQQRICRVAGCSLTRSLIDGQWYIDIANGEYDLESLPVLTDDDILSFEEQPTLLDNAVNSVSIKYFDPVKKEAITTAPVQSPALISDFGTNHLTIECLEIPTDTLAARVAQRELLARITPLRGFLLKIARKPYAWRPSTYFRLQAPKRGIADMVCILGEKSCGQLRSGAMTISATQDVYSLPTVTFVEVESGVDTRPGQTPRTITAQHAFEAPYIDVVTALSRADLAALPPEVGYLLAVAADPATSRNFTLMVDAGAGYEETGHGDWASTALVVEASGYDDTAFTLEGGYRLSQVEVGTPALWGTEVVRVDAIDTITGAVNLGRGCADTVPVKHTAGERIWFYQTAAAADTIEYTDGETISAKLLTNTGSQQLPIASATALPLTFAQRQFRPYPPAGVTVNSASFPEAVTGDAVISAVARNRATQADQLVDWTMATIAAEAGTTYSVRNVDVETDTQTHLTTGITAWPHTIPAADLRTQNRVEVWSVRDGVESWQRVQIPFTGGTALLAETGDAITTEDGDAILME